MKRWLIEFEVISHVTLKNPEEALSIEAPDKSFECQVMNLKSESGTLDPTLAVQIILYEEDWKLAEERAEEYFFKFIDCLALTINTRLKYKRVRRVIDWSRGLKKRDYIFYQRFSDPNCPIPLLSQEHLKSAFLFLKADTNEKLDLAMKWYRLALVAKLPEEFFQYFWFALEILANHEKEKTLVSDKCPQCQSPLFCKTCNKISQHYPYPKQAIEELIKKTVRTGADKFYNLVQTVRHSLMHGESRKAIEEKNNIDLDKVKDILGRVVWTALFNCLKRNLKDAKDEDKFICVHPRTFSQYILGSEFHTVLTAPEGSDLDSPRIEDFPYPPVNVTLLTREEIDSQEEFEHAPLE